MDGRIVVHRGRRGGGSSVLWSMSAIALPLWAKAYAFIEGHMRLPCAADCKKTQKYD
jgi:hypothetical protein